MTIPRRVVPLGVVLSALTITLPAWSQITGSRVEKLPIGYVDRPLTLPEMTLGAELDLTIDHIEIFLADATGSSLDIWGAFGIGEDVEVETVVFSLATEDFAVLHMTPFEPIGDADWGTWRIGATVRFLATESAELGARFRFLVDNNGTIGFNGGIPILVRAGHVFRLDTGVNFMGLVSTQSDNASFGFFDVSTNPSAPGPGIPLRFTFQPIEFLNLGFTTGFGIFDVENEDTIFLPLGFHLGGSLELDPVLLDLMATANFPLFVLPTENTSDDRIVSELWQIGLSAKVHYKIPE